MPGQSRKSINKNKTICVQCKTPVLDNEDSMQCDMCEKTLHCLCTKLDKKQIEKLVNDHSLEYKCHFCAPNNNNTVVSDLAEIKTKLNQLDDIKETMNFMSAQYDAILKGVAKNKKKIDALQKENNNLREEVKSLKSSVKFLNDARVKNDCVINGIKVDGDVNATGVVLEIAKKAGADICEDEVDDAYFLNKSKQPGTKSVVVKFSNNKAKQTFMHEKSKLKNIDGFKSVYVNDFLSRESMQMFNYAKSLKSVGYKFVFTKGGTVFAQFNENSKQIRLRTMDDVDKILCKSAGGVSKKRQAAENESSDDDDDDGSSFRSPN